MVLRKKRKVVRIRTQRKIGFRISDVGRGGREFNTREDEIFKSFKKNRRR